MKRLLGVITLLVLGVLLVACAPSSYDKAKEKMENANYACLGGVYDEVQKDGSVASLTGTINLQKGFTAVLYDSAKNAKAAYNETKDAEGKTDYVLVGKWVIIGSEEAVKAFKK